MVKADSHLTGKATMPNTPQALRAQDFFIRRAEQPNKPIKLVGHYRIIGDIPKLWDIEVVGSLEVQGNIGDGCRLFVSDGLSAHEVYNGVEITAPRIHVGNVGSFCKFTSTREEPKFTSLGKEFTYIPKGDASRLPQESMQKKIRDCTGLSEKVISDDERYDPALKRYLIPYNLINDDRCHRQLGEIFKRLKAQGAHLTDEENMITDSWRAGKQHFWIMTIPENAPNPHTLEESMRREFQELGKLLGTKQHR